MSELLPKVYPVVIVMGCAMLYLSVAVASKHGVLTQVRAGVYLGWVTALVLIFPAVASMFDFEALIVWWLKWSAMVYILSLLMYALEQSFRNWRK